MRLTHKAIPLRVLVVDDKFLVALLAASMLEDLGCERHRFAAMKRLVGSRATRGSMCA